MQLAERTLIDGILVMAYATCREDSMSIRLVPAGALTRAVQILSDYDKKYFSYYDKHAVTKRRAASAFRRQIKGASPRDRPDALPTDSIYI